MIWFQKLPSQTIQCHRSLSEHSATELDFLQTCLVSSPQCEPADLRSPSRFSKPDVHSSALASTPDRGLLLTPTTLGWTSGRSRQRNRPSTAPHVLISLFYCGIRFRFFFLRFVDGGHHGSGEWGMYRVFRDARRRSLMGWIQK